MFDNFFTNFLKIKNRKDKLSPAVIINVSFSKVVSSPPP